MQRVEIDDWECHLHNLAIQAELWDSLSPAVQEAAEKTRCTLSAAICCKTRVLPALVLSLGPHSVNIKTLLRMCMTDKTALALAVGCETPWEYRGNPYQAAGDEGSAILNARTRAICDAAVIEFICPQIETPQQRPKIERLFQTLEIRSLLRFSGRAFSNPQVRAKYQAEARAVVTVEELAHLIVRFADRFTLSDDQNPFIAPGWHAIDVTRLHRNDDNSIDDTVTPVGRKRRGRKS